MSLRNGKCYSTEKRPYEFINKSAIIKKLSYSTFSINENEKCEFEKNSHNFQLVIKIFVCLLNLDKASGSDTYL